MLIAILISLIFSCSTESLSEREQGVLRVKVENVESKEGMLWLGIYRSEEDFLVKEKAILKGLKISSTGKMEIEVPDLPYGEYAFALFHDENNNGEMDRNLVGIPSEPFSFSKAVKSKFRVPKYEEVKFQFQENNQEIHTRLSKWWKMKAKK